jgi:hypothetical protein
MPTATISVNSHLAPVTAVIAVRFDAAYKHVLVTPTAKIELEQLLVSLAKGFPQCVNCLSSISNFVTVFFVQLPT